MIWRSQALKLQISSGLHRAWSGCTTACFLRQNDNEPTLVSQNFVRLRKTFIWKRTDIWFFFCYRHALVICKLQILERLAAQGHHLFGIARTELSPPPFLAVYTQVIDSRMVEDGLLFIVYKLLKTTTAGFEYVL